MRIFRWWLMVLSMSMATFAIHAQEIPAALEDWQNWVLHDTPQHECPFVANQHPQNAAQCAWPGRLALEISGHGATFELGVRVDAPSWIDLPGDSRHWPQNVNVDGHPAPVLANGGQPAVWLDAGQYTLRGNLPWKQRPPRLRVPDSIGLIDLRIDGTPVSRLERNGEQITLGEAVVTKDSIDALSIRIYRHLQDGIPAQLETRIQMEVSGAPREQLLGPVLPVEFSAISLYGELPARLENDGRLRVQLRPGQWTLRLNARAADLITQTRPQSADTPWPAQEIWSYADTPQLRSTRASGSVTDATQAGVPMEWRNLPAFVVDTEQGLAVEAGLRGIENGSNDQLQLIRDIWLDFNGEGLTAADQLIGQLRLPQRLRVNSPWRLQRAEQNAQPMLITRDDQGAEGIEVRDRELHLQAGLRVDRYTGTLPINAWQLPLEQIQTTLHLPYGYRLIGTRGVDQSPDSWIAKWSLFDLFAVALIALLAGRMLGWKWSLVAVLALALSQHEANAPRWTCAAALGFALLMHALPEGRLRMVSRISAIVLLVVAIFWTLPFTANQVHLALHPQLESSSLSLHDFNTRSAVPASAAMRDEYVEDSRVMQDYGESEMDSAVPVPEEAQSNMMQRRIRSTDTPMHPSAPLSPPPAPVSAAGSDSVAVRGGAFSQSKSIGQLFDSRSVMQAGAGIPKWNIHSNDYYLAWSSPVTAEQTMRLIIAPAWAVQVLRIVMVAALIALLARLALALGAPLHKLIKRKPIGKSKTAAVGIALALCVPICGLAQTTPAPEMLDELRNRLLKAPQCAPHCASVAMASIHADDQGITLDMEAHAGANVALPLPISDSGLHLIRMSVDGQADTGLAQRNGTFVARLTPGVHRVALRYQSNGGEEAKLRFPMPPQRLSFTGQGWIVDGIDEERLLGDALTLRREHDDASSAPQTGAQSFQPYVRLTRRLVLGLDWSVENIVERIAPVSDGFTVSLPLLPGEHPLGEDTQVKDQRISVTFNSNQAVAQWTSRLDHAAELQISAPPLAERAESWEIDAAPIWHVDAQGLPPSDSASGIRFQPLPGEVLTLQLSKPEAVEGASIAFDLVSLSSNAGERVSDSTLTLTARSTRGGEHVILLPPDTELLSATRDETPLKLAIRDNELSLPIRPGQQIFTLRLRATNGVSWRTVTPRIDLRAPAANITLNQHMPHNRWVLWTWGPTAGPAVLYWSHIIVLLIAAWLLARYAPTPLRLHHWILLGLGFSAFSWLAFCLVAGWLILFGIRSRRVPFTTQSVWRFDIAQILLFILALAALITLIAAVPNGLLGLPDMHVKGMDSTAWNLTWTSDRTPGALPHGSVFSVSLWIYKIAMLAWALWLANALIGWIRWAFEAWTTGGYWRPIRKPSSAKSKTPSETASTDKSSNTEKKTPPELPTSD